MIPTIPTLIRKLVCNQAWIEPTTSEKQFRVITRRAIATTSTSRARPRRTSQRRCSPLPTGGGWPTCLSNSFGTRRAEGFAVPTVNFEEEPKETNILTEQKLTWALEAQIPFNDTIINQNYTLLQIWYFYLTILNMLCSCSSEKTLLYYLLCWNKWEDFTANKKWIQKHEPVH